VEHGVAVAACDVILEREDQFSVIADAAIGAFATAPLIRKQVKAQQHKTKTKQPNNRK
jgi:hypothetical protein